MADFGFFFFSGSSELSSRSGLAASVIFAAADNSSFRFARQQIDHILHPQRLGHRDRRLISRNLIVLGPQSRADQTAIERRTFLVLLQRI